MAIQGLKNVYWILGGLPKKNDKINISKINKKIIKCYIIGKDVNFFKNQIKNRLSFKVTKNLKNSIVQIFRDMRSKRSVIKYVLLSPAAASFDQFLDFENRGDEYKRLCKKYANKFV